MSAAFSPTAVRRADSTKAAGGAGAGAATAVARPKIHPIPILRSPAKYNANIKPVAAFDAAKLGFGAPPAGEFYKDGMDGISIPLTYDGEYAMNHGFYVGHGRFDLVESAIKGERQLQLVANYPVHAPADGLPEDADVRKKDMYALLSAIVAVEDKAKKAIAADDKGAMFGVAFAAHELESKTRTDGKLEKGKFSSLVYAGSNKSTGEPAYLKSYFKLPLLEGTRLYCTLTLNGVAIDTPDIAEALDAITWRNDVGIVFSFRDLYKCSHGISLRVRIDTVGVREPPKPVHVPLINPFVAGTKMLEDS